MPGRFWNAVLVRGVHRAGSAESSPKSAARVVQKFAPEWALKPRSSTKAGATGANLRENADSAGPKSVHGTTSRPNPRA